jgi:hypothetical protein
MARSVCSRSSEFGEILNLTASQFPRPDRREWVGHVDRNRAKNYITGG